MKWIPETGNVGRFSVAAVLLLVIGFTAANELRAQASVVAVDGAGIFGGDPPKFACNNLCKQVAGAGCTQAQPPVNCMAVDANGNFMNVGTVCGENIVTVNTVMGCEVNVAGGVDPCVNGKAPAKCYTAKNCVCTVSLKNGVTVCLCTSQGTATARGDTVGSDNC